MLVTWTGHDSHASDARFTFVLQQFDATGSLVQVAQAVRINQRLTPNGPSFGGRSWQSLGVFASEGATLKVQLTDDANGTVIADAIRLVAVDPITKQPLATLPNLHRLALTGNPLDDAAHQMIAPQFTARAASDPSFVFSFTPNQGLQWQTIYGPLGMATGTSLLLQLIATDGNAGDHVFYTAFSDNPNVSVTVTGNKLQVTAAANFIGTARITVAGQDGPSGPGDWRGRKAEQTFDLNVGVSAVTGSKWQDTNGNGIRDAGEPGLEGVTIFLDLNGNGTLDGAATATPNSPWAVVNSLASGSYAGDVFSGFITFDSAGFLYVGDEGHIHRYDPDLHRFIQFTESGDASQDARGPRSIAFGADGALYVASTDDRNIRIYNGQTGAFIATTWPENNGTLFSDVGMMAASPDRQTLYIVDFNPSATQVKILRYDTLSRSLVSGAFTVDRVAGVFDAPSDIALGPDGNIYIADRALGSIVRLNGTTGAALPAPGKTGAVFVSPGTPQIGTDPKLAFDTAGRLIVASNLDFVLSFNTATGTLVGTAVIAKGGAVPLDVAFDAQGRLYLSVDGNHVLVAKQGEPTSLTDANGAYAFNGLVPATYTAVELVPANSGQTFDLGQAPSAIVDINPGAGSSNPNQLILFNNALYFQADGGDGKGVELWRYDGKSATRVTDINPNAGSSFPSNFILLNNALYFTATNPTFGTELWRYDGIDVTLAADINPNAGSSSPTNLFVFNGVLLFTATNGSTPFANGNELWRYDPVTGLGRITDINPGTGSSNISGLTLYNGAVYFSAFDGGTSGTELWRYNGSNVALVSDLINPGALSSSPTNLFAFGGFLYFSAVQSSVRELWRYNGSTFVRTTINAGTSPNPANLIGFNGAVYFTATNLTSGTELWRWSPVSGYAMVGDINPGAGSSLPGSLIVFNDALYFSATDAATAGAFGRELWRYDGTTVSRVTDINPGTGSSNPASPVIFDNALYFTATDNGILGNELWRYDGTTVSLAADIDTGTASSFPAEMIAFNGSLYMRATGPTQGAELAVYNLRGAVGTQTVALLSGHVAVGRDFGNFKVVDIGADRSVTEGAAVNFNATVIDPTPGTPSTFTYLWQIVADNGQTIPNSTATTLNFIPVDNGIYTVMLSVTDSADNKIYRDTAVVFVNNAPPVVTAGTDATLTEGSTFTRSVSFTDPGADVWTATVDYGDGTPVAILTTPTPSSPLALNHLYSDNGHYGVVVTIMDDDGGSATQSFAVNVTNVAPTVNAGADQTVPEGTPVTLLATASDPGANDALTIQWIVTASNGQVIAPATGNSFTFTPIDNGTYQIAVTVTDKDLATATDQVLITATNVAPAIGLNGPSTIGEGSLYTLTLGPVSDPGADAVTEYRVAWGDGTPPDIFGTASAITHTYLNEGSRTISVTLVDEDGTYANAASKPVAVQNVAAVLTGLTPSATNLTENGILNLTGTFIDPGMQDSHSVKILWGDGTSEQTVVLAPGIFQFAASHQYLDDNPSGTSSDLDAISVRVNDGTEDSAPLTTNLTVNNVAPTFSALTASGATVTEGASLTLNGAVSDIGSLDSHTVAVNWGDGSAAQ
ncbi:MAG: hypothetical protein DMG78_20980, partial [Acidobacteria bacterium]